MDNRKRSSEVIRRSKNVILREDSPPYRVNGNGSAHKLKFIDLFCGIGGFRLALESVAKKFNAKTECVFSSDIDEDCRRAYLGNFGEEPRGDITKVPADAIPHHDVLLAGFPCQPFSIIGHMKGFEDARGTFL